MATAHRSSAIPLALLFAALIIYASLYPFADWRWPGGLRGLEWLLLPMPPWRDRFDIVANLLGYLPLGALIYLAGVRSGGRPWAVWLAAVAGAALLSWVLEVSQHFLPGRFPSALDWLLNAAGAVLGATLGALTQALRLIQRWQQTRDRWFLRRSSGALVLMLLWPFGLLFPTPFPLGLGPSWERLQEELIDWLLDAQWAQRALEWVMDLSPMLDRLPGGLEAVGMVLGLLGPCLLAFSVTRPGWRRAVMAVGAVVLGWSGTALSAAMNFGPAHALAWVTPAVVPATALALVLALLLVRAPQRLVALLGMAGLSGLLWLVMRAPSDPYFALSLHAWEQGRFIRFHGLAQWVGWLWPLAALAWLAGRSLSSERMTPLAAR